jgi:hydrogenase nickel incorporation protein HypA/HybF
MHELALCQSIERIVGRVAPGREVLAVELDVGELRQVVPEALESCWRLLTAETALAGSRLVIRSRPAILRCQACAATTRLSGPPLLRCAVCGSTGVDILSGEEFLVRSLEVEEKDGAVPPSR